MAPWCWGMGLLVSFTAAAGHNVDNGASLARLPSRNAAIPADLMAPTPDEAAFSARRMPDSIGGARVYLAARIVGEREDLRGVSDEIEPRGDLKRNAGVFPSADQSRKGDPAVGLRPTFDAKWRLNNRRAAVGFNELLFGAHDYLAFSFPASPTDAQEDALIASPDDGATPAVPRSLALSSATPASGIESPVEIVETASVRGNTPSVAAPPRATVATLAARLASQPDYAALIDRNQAKVEMRCLAEAIYFEARSESEEGQAAVAQVVLNRVKSGLYPASVCGVVYQNRNHYLGCQFSFACEGKSLRVAEPAPWRVAERIAEQVLQGKTYLSDVGAATHYHAEYARPSWARALKKTDKIGAHIFYALRPGQT